MIGHVQVLIATSMIYAPEGSMLEQYIVNNNVA